MSELSFKLTTERGWESGGGGGDFLDIVKETEALIAVYRQHNNPVVLGFIWRDGAVFRVLKDEHWVKP